MTGQNPYSEHHPRWHRQRVSTWWWLRNWRYLWFILRELSSLSVAWFVVTTLWQLHALSRGPAAWAEAQAALRSPALLVLNAVALCFVLLHALTWFRLAPRAMVVRLGDRRVPDGLVAAAGYLSWAGASAAAAWWILGG
jgi:fumarate reductase subunit C